MHLASPYPRYCYISGSGRNFDSWEVETISTFC